MMEALREQYERFPYPPVPFLALPRRGQGRELRYPRGQKGIRILIAGCGTLETAVVAQNHPEAAEIVAADLSERSLAISKQRLRWMRFARPLTRLAPIRWVHGDLRELELGKFDYILASNVLHHVSDPAAMLRRLADALNPGGLLRIVTYPKGSRYWMRETSKWFREHGLNANTPDLVHAARRVIRELPMENAIRSCFESQPETHTHAGIIDAFFNACENPLTPLQWQQSCHEAGLRLVAEGQSETSRSQFLDPFLGDPGALSAWEKLQILDDTWEFCSNLVLWLEKSPRPEDAPNERADARDLAEQLGRAERLLKKAGRTLREYQQWLRKEVGPRVNPRRPDELLRGLSLVEYDLDGLLSKRS